MISRFVWRNLWRNQRRTLITMASVLFAVVLAISMRSLQVGTFGNLIKNVVSFHTGYIQIHRGGYWEEQTINNSFRYDSFLGRLIESNDEVTALVPRLEAFVLASSGQSTRGCLCIGADPLAENTLTGLKSRLVAGDYLTRTGDGVLMAEGLLNWLKLSLGDTLVLLTQGYQGVQAAGKYPIRGIVRFGSPQLNESLLFMPLPAAQYFLGAEGRLTSIALALKSADDLEATRGALAQQLGNSYEVMTWKQIMPEIQNHIEADGFFYWIMIGILYIVIAFGIFGTSLMMMNERKYELGMLLAIGMKRRLLALSLFGETVLVSLLGAAGGAVLSLPLVWILEEHPITFSGRLAQVYEQFGFAPIMPTIIDLNIFLEQAAIVFAIALTIALYPMMRAWRLNVVLSMKR